MTEEQKTARKLTLNFWKETPEKIKLVSGKYFEIPKNIPVEIAKNCARVCVDTILKHIPFETEAERNFWKTVKKEIKKI